MPPSAPLSSSLLIVLPVSRVFFSYSDGASLGDSPSYDASARSVGWNVHGLSCLLRVSRRFFCNYCALSHTSYGFVATRALRCARAVVDSGAASSLSRSLEAGFFLLASCRLLVTSRGFVVSPALVHFLRLPSPPQFRSKGAADPTHAPTLRRRRGIWQKAGFFLEKPFFCRLLADFWSLPGALC